MQDEQGCIIIFIELKYGTWNCLKSFLRLAVIISSGEEKLSKVSSCEIPRNSRAESLQCFSQRGLEKTCKGRVPVNTLVSFVCPDFYTVKSGISMCQGRSNWSAPIDCTPGKIFEMY